MSVVLPPKIAVTRFLREQLQRKQGYRDWLDAVHERHWSGGKLRGMSLTAFAAEYEREFLATGAYSIERQGSSAQLGANINAAFEIQGRTLWPISLGTADAGATGPYTEDAFLIMRVGAAFTRKKVVNHEAPLNVCLTRHALERMIERGALSGDIDSLLADVLPKFTDDLAITLGCGLMKETDGDEWTRTAFIPFLNGLAVVTNRLLTGPLYSQDFGYRFNFEKNHYAWSYLKKELIAPPADGSDGRLSGGASVSSWCVTTFLAREQLKPGQHFYARDWHEWRMTVPADVSRYAYDLHFNPDFVSRADRSPLGKEKMDEREVSHLAGLLSSQDFQAHSRFPLALLLEPDTSSQTLQTHSRSAAGVGTRRSDHLI